MKNINKTIQSEWLEVERAYKEKREIDYILWELTHKCNLQCIHCRASASPHTEETIISGEKVISLMKEIQKLGRPTVVFTGGEPLIRNDLIQLAQIASENKVPFRVQSNGLLLTEKLSKKLHDFGIISFGIGIDGPEEIHDMIRNKKGAFKKAINAIKILNKYDIPAHAEFTIMRLNMNHIGKTLDLLEKEVFLNTFLARSAIFAGRTNPKNKEFLLTSSEYMEKLHEIYLESKKRSFTVQSQDPLYCRVNPELIKSFKKYGNLSTGNILSGCSSGLNMLNIRPNGDVGVCAFLPQVIGNIKSDTLINIWKNRGKFEFINRLISRDISGSCSKCKFKFICGGCRARSLGANDNLFAEDPYCKGNIII